MRDDTILVSIMHVNNEIGVVQDIAAIGELCRSKGIIYHVDATQSVGNYQSISKLKVDLFLFLHIKFTDLWVLVRFMFAVNHAFA